MDSNKYAVQIQVVTAHLTLTTIIHLIWQIISMYARYPLVMQVGYTGGSLSRFVGRVVSPSHQFCIFITSTSVLCINMTLFE